MDQPGLHGRHRDKDGEISRKHGNTLVSTMQKVYGPSFAPGAAPHEKLSAVLAEMESRRFPGSSTITTVASWRANSPPSRPDGSPCSA